MTAPDAQDLRWENGVPVSGRFDDPYYSREDGLAETRHVFLEGCRVAERLRDGFSIAELGFGTGLNFCATLAQWQAHGPAEGTCEYTAFEMYPMQAAELDRALAVWPELDAQRAALVAAWRPEGGTMRIGGVRLTLVIGDARRTVPDWGGNADAQIESDMRAVDDLLSRILEIDGDAPVDRRLHLSHSPFRKLGVTDEDSNC